MLFTCEIHFIFSILSSLLYFFRTELERSKGKKGRGEEGEKGKGRGAREKLGEKRKGRGGRKREGERS